MRPWIYKGARTREISFPLGGIGTGCIGLAGNGRLVDWEIFNRPNKGGLNGFSHFAIKAESGGRVLDARVLHGDLPPPYTGALGPASSASHGRGPRREYLAGLPHFREVEFRGEYPLAELRFKERKFPGRVRLKAFNPFIPLDDRNSGIPAAFFEVEVSNTTPQTLLYTLAGTLGNPLPAPNAHRLRRRQGAHLLHLASEAFEGGEPGAGDLTLATDAAAVSWQQYWFRGAWFDALEVFWRDFSAGGRFENRRYARAGAGDHGVLAAHLRVGPGQTGRARFVIAWNFPNCENYWKEDAGSQACKAGVPAHWKNYYATLFEDSRASALYSLKHWKSLYGQTLSFKEALFSSDLPAAALEAVSANLSILKSPTVLRLEDGTFYGWEGCNPGAGCCEGSCTHVWNYAQALPFLFPQLERSMRSADYRYNPGPEGGMAFRLQLPLGVPRSGFRPCADGQFGGVMKAYRDWKISGDSQWLRSIWEELKQSIDFAWSPHNEDRWDPEETGVLWGRQHHTLDMELFGPNAWLTGFYLGALKAGAKMAEFFGEAERAAHYGRLFARGKRWADAYLFNGEYYDQQIDLEDRALPGRFGAGEAYWNPEHGEIKYQIGQGCALDQVLAQWHANLYGLGEIFAPRQNKKALRSIFKYNFKRSMREFYNPCRVYCLNDEAGLVICEWPAGRAKPAIPLTYAQETMHGFEYAAAAQMIQAGLRRQGIEVIEAVRARYDGERRNPWNEFECGNNYARSMASYALLNAFSGFEFDLVRGMIGFNPVEVQKGKFRCFWSLGTAWGLFVLRPAEVKLEVLGGHLRIRTLHLPFLRGRQVRKLSLGGKVRAWTEESGGRIELGRAARLGPGRPLRLRLPGARKSAP